MGSSVFVVALYAFITSVLAVPAEPAMRCPNGWQFVNGQTNAVMYDDRDIRTCDREGATSCMRIQFKYKTPEVTVNGEYDMPCISPKKLPSFDLNTLFPEAALPLDINLKVCIPDQPEQCVDFTPPAPINLYCNRGVVVVDTTNDATLLNDVTMTQCKGPQTGCYTMTQYFTQGTKSAMRMVGGCYDEWRSYDFIWDRFYPYTDFTGGFCEKHGCTTFKVWHRDNLDTKACYCAGGKKIDGTYGKPIVNHCSGSMCNSMRW